ncbi:hypothetical protein RJZ56_000627 [Blastomyces dermatitidis]|uniref:Uncharacterized protein n=2 Tax=Ajellomyces dermatitidis TaxID=5039 RepID=F2TFS5_AJEDA|nr:uncharacterized protein BDCG_04385 [Blastomyces dermatitidis ER-3]EEQ89265.1 hypothetical protein BDCG_04385 [Blastomyces dermatitidis ER-3]EGE82088.1 hypothetical protein BDDG_05031 [Blastomyces dermatitidis ATCC 18188]EQL33413.1 hypothetical protein BDFG_04563 [Blastomyces dermatitidis ATCC 26199]
MNLHRSPLPINPLHSLRRLTSHRPFSTPPAAPPPPKATPSRLRTRLQTFNNRLPRFLRSYTTPLFNAPVTHITSFLILHEITAIVPLLGLTGAFHYWGWIPVLGDGTVDEGVKKFGRWLKKKGWVGGEAEVQAGAVAEAEMGMRTAKSTSGGNTDTDKGVRLILEFATAYAITKAMLPVRIVLSVWATPWFARGVLGPVGRAVGKVFGRKA